MRKNLVKDDLVDCIVMLPTQLFYNTGIPACLWFLSRHKNGNKKRNRAGEVLFIDASEMGYMLNRRNRTFADQDIAKIAGTYHQWKSKDGDYEDIKGFCKSATLTDQQFIVVWKANTQQRLTTEEIEAHRQNC
ncbi:N-6 DNA methylase [Spirulina sp. CS-785/01]|nr:N-6 DNA methylase [Spirulina sp. CS-785/01]MDB9313827.1 N-6 DNA methylase [Spirulina sp. CS-785/01]